MDNICANKRQKNWCLRFFIASLILLSTQINAFAKNVEIEWEIVGRFRLIKDAASETRLFDLAKLAPHLQCAVDSRNSCGKNDYLNVLSEFEKNAPKGNIGFKTMPATFYNPIAGKYDENYVKYPSHWKIKFKISNEDAGSKKCNWYLDNVALKGEGNCRNFEFETPISIGQTVRVEMEDGSIGTVTVKPTDILVVGMGDSYASGEGMPDVPAVTGVSPAQWFDEKCHLSLLSAQSLTAARLAAQNPHQSVTFISRACSGAIISDLIDPPNNTQIPKRLGRIAALCYGGKHNTDCATAESKILLTQLTAVNHDLSSGGKQKRQPDLVLLSISGNDYGFVDAIKEMLTTDFIESKEKDKKFDLSDAYKKVAFKNRYEVWRNLPELAYQLTQDGAGFPDATIVQVGYPNPLMRDGKKGEFCAADSLNGQHYYQISEQSGLVGNIADSIINRLRMKGTQNEYIALHDDFIVPLTGTVADMRFIEINKEPVYSLRDASIGISCALATNDHDALKNTERLRTKFVSKECDDYRDGKFGFSIFKGTDKWRFSLARNESGGKADQAYTQLKGFVVNGFCLNDTHKGVQGRWFNVLGDALTNLSSTGDILGFFAGAHSGTAHPNIYGQLFLAERAWVAIPQKFK